jgi:hypothetical protein
MTTGTIHRNVDNIGMGDMLRPEIKLIQNTGGDVAKSAGAKSGQFYNTMTNEVYPDGFEFVVLDFSIQRVYWGRDIIGDEPPTCTSMDANSYESANGDNCRECPHLLDNAALVQAKERREKCTKQFGFIGLLLPNLEPFMFRAPGTSSTAVQALISRFKFNKACRNEAGEIEYHRFKVTAHSQETKTTQGNVWVLKFGEITPFGDANFEHELFLTSAQMLGQTANLLTSGPTAGEKETQTITSKDVGKVPNSIVNPPPVKAPKVNVIQPKQSTPKKMDLDI